MNEGNDYNEVVWKILETTEFRRWILRLRDRRARGQIGIRLQRVARGNFGNARSVGGRVSELRINYGPGYRIYFTRIGETVIMLLIGGDKDSQNRDIRVAQRLAREYH